MDNTATDVFDDYEFYWRGMKDEWRRFREKEEALDKLRKAVKSDRHLHPNYPLETKIMELSHIGYRHPKRLKSLNKDDVSSLSQEVGK